VDELEQLDRELHVSNAAPPPLQLDAFLPRRPDVFLDACFRRPHVFDRRRGQNRGVHEGRHCTDEPLSHFQVAGNRASLEESLALPGRRVPLVVLDHRVDRPRKRPGPAFRPKRGVHPQDQSVFGGLRQEGPHRRGGLRRRFLCGTTPQAVNEQHVHVGGVVELLSSQLAQADHGEISRSSRIEGDPKADLRDRSELGHHLVDGRPRQVARGEPVGGPAAKAAQARRRSETARVHKGFVQQLSGKPRPNVRQRLELFGM
jgi:hypothetical protein